MSFKKDVIRLITSKTNKYMLIFTMLNLLLLAIPVNMNNLSVVTSSSPAEQVFLHNKQYKNNSIPVLMYHHIISNDEAEVFRNNNYVITEQQFDKQMRLLYNNGFYTITPVELEEFLYSKRSLPEKSIMITFDDGYLSNYIYAYPILKRYGFKATIFLITEYTINQSQPDFEYLNRDHIKASSDVFNFGSHTHSLHYQENNKSLLLTKPVEIVKGDLEYSKEFITANCFSYPFGQYHDTIISLLKESGFKIAFTSRDGRVDADDNPFLLPRFNIGPKITEEKFKSIVGIFD